MRGDMNSVETSIVLEYVLPTRLNVDEEAVPRENDPPVTENDDTVKAYDPPENEAEVEAASENTGV